VLRDAYRGAEGSAAATDDAALVQEAGVPITAVPGDERALKITTLDDLVIARAYLEEQR
jgi:2-C-methyl-D-erythritol 4-phosphate cytidylyltransferase